MVDRHHKIGLQVNYKNLFQLAKIQNKSKANRIKILQIFHPELI